MKILRGVLIVLAVTALVLVTVVGCTGSEGSKGPTGATGAQGPAGPAGPAGADGADGATGAQGPAGADGADGAQGPAGPAGLAGPPVAASFTATDAGLTSTFAGNIDVTGTLGVTGVTTLGALDATSIGATTPGTGAFTTLDVGAGDFTVAANGDTVIQGALTVYGATQINNTLGVSGNTSLTGSLDPRGDINKTVAGDLDIATASGNDDIVLSPGGTAQLTASTTGVTIAGTLSVTGAITSGTWQATVIGVLYGGTGVSTFGDTNTILYTTATDTLSKITAVANGVLVTDGSSVPTIETDLPAAVTIGGAYVYRVGGTDVLDDDVVDTITASLYLPLAGGTMSGPINMGTDNIKIESGTGTAGGGVGGVATLHAQAGVVTTGSLTTAGGSDYILTLTNSKIAAVSNVLVTVGYGTSTAGYPIVLKVTPGSGTVAIVILNSHTSAAFNGTLLIQFLVVNP